MLPFLLHLPTEKIFTKNFHENYSLKIRIAEQNKNSNSIKNPPLKVHPLVRLPSENKKTELRLSRNNATASVRVSHRVRPSLIHPHPNRQADQTAGQITRKKPTQVTAVASPQLNNQSYSIAYISIFF